MEIFKNIINYAQIIPNVKIILFFLSIFVPISRLNNINLFFFHNELSMDYFLFQEERK